MYASDVQPAVFLDRDNTLIANDGDLGEPERVRLIDGVAEGLRRLREAGFRLVVVTNQGGVARGRYTEEEVDAVHMRIAQLVDEVAGCQNLIDRFYYCPYHPEATVAEYRREHPWRKPNPGMMVQAARDLALDLTNSWLIGDQVRDIQAGRSAGCRTILISSEPTVAAQAQPSATVDDFGEAVELILNEARPRASRFDRTSAASLTESAATERLEAPSVLMGEMSNIRRAVHDLAEEIRLEHLRRTAFTPLRLAAGLVQLLVLLLALLGLMQVQQTDAFLKWMAGAGLVQLLVLAILVADQRG